jgi:hypothetical protein
MITNPGDCGWDGAPAPAIARRMADHDAEQGDAEPSDRTVPEAVEIAAARRDNCQRHHIAQRVIAALRRGGINCAVVLTDRDESH